PTARATRRAAGEHRGYAAPTRSRAFHRMHVCTALRLRARRLQGQGAGARAGRRRRGEAEALRSITGGDREMSGPLLDVRDLAVHFPAVPKAVRAVAGV